MLYTSIETFINYRIPNNYIFSKSDGNKFTRTYNYEQIQRQISTEDKIKEILNKIENKNFSKKYPIKQQHINNLKEIRDSIVHTKQLNIYEEYERVFKLALKFDSISTLNAVIDFINYYEPNLIEPCPCESDY